MSFFRASPSAVRLLQERLQVERQKPKADRTQVEKSCALFIFEHERKERGCLVFVIKTTDNNCAEFLYCFVVI